MKRHIGWGPEGSWAQRATLLACGCIHQPRSSLNPVVSGIIMEASSHRHHWLLTQSQPPSFIQRTRHGSEVLSFLLWLGLSGDSPHSEITQEPAESHLIRTKDTPNPQEIPRAFGALCKMFLSSPTTQEITRILGALCQDLGAETKFVFLIMSQPASCLVKWVRWLKSLCTTLWHRAVEFR